MPKLSLEINVLTPMTTIDPQAVDAEKSELLLSKIFFTGIFLVEVAFSKARERITFIDEFYYEAELSRVSYREVKAKLFIFESES